MDSQDSPIIDSTEMLSTAARLVARLRGFGVTSVLQMDNGDVRIDLARQGGLARLTAPSVAPEPGAPVDVAGGASNVYAILWERKLLPPLDAEHRQRRPQYSASVSMRHGRDWVRVPESAVLFDGANELVSGIDLSGIVALKCSNDRGSPIYGFFRRCRGRGLSLTPLCDYELGCLEEQINQTAAHCPVCSTQSLEPCSHEILRRAMQLRVPGCNFASIAFGHFQSLQDRARVALRRPPARRDTSTCTLDFKGGECTVCLEKTIVSRRRCDTCEIPICDACHRKMRGLCPICDREKYSVPLLCFSCGNLHPLARGGLECPVCGIRCLCTDCHRANMHCACCE